MLGEYFIHEVGDDEKAFDWYLKSAEQGNARSQNMMGFMYRYGGRGCEQDQNEAYVWFKKESKQHDI